MNFNSFSFVDLETSGTSALNGEIIEIGIIRVENFKVVSEFKSLVRPMNYVDPFILKMTNIKKEELENAPSFSSIKKDIIETLVDSIFVAHNVRFDYSFLKQHFKRENIDFTQRYMCTVKLARNLFPGLSAYNLDALINAFNFKCKNRHRAYDDANVLWQMFKLSKKIHGEEKLYSAIKTVMKNVAVPVNFDQKKLDVLPEACGVYIFKGKNGETLYIGKSVNIKDRVLSHFSNDGNNLTDMELSKLVFDIEYIETEGELGALLLESSLVKHKQPILNKQLRYSKKLNILVMETENNYSTIKIQEVEKLNYFDASKILGIFKSKKDLIDFLFNCAKEYNLCPKILKIEKGRGKCFYYELGRCKGACINKENCLSYNIRFTQAFSSKKIKNWMFNGPVLIKEGNEGFIVDKWCLIDKVKNGILNFDKPKEYVFDYDAYKIFLKFLRNPNNLKKITTLSLINSHSPVL